MLAGVSLYLLVLFFLEYTPCDYLSFRSFVCVALRLEVRACLQKSMAIFLQLDGVKYCFSMQCLDTPCPVTLNLDSPFRISSPQTLFNSQARSKTCRPSQSPFSSTAQDRHSPHRSEVSMSPSPRCSTLAKTGCLWRTCAQSSIMMNRC